MATSIKANNLRHNYSKKCMDTLRNADALKKSKNCRKTKWTIKQNIWYTREYLKLIHSSTLLIQGFIFHSNQAYKMFLKYQWRLFDHLRKMASQQGYQHSQLFTNNHLPSFHNTLDKETGFTVHNCLTL